MLIDSSALSWLGVMKIIIYNIFGFTGFVLRVFISLCRLIWYRYLLSRHSSQYKIFFVGVSIIRIARNPKFFFVFAGLGSRSYLMILAYFKFVHLLFCCWISIPATLLLFAIYTVCCGLVIWFWNLGPSYCNIVFLIPVVRLISFIRNVFTFYRISDEFFFRVLDDICNVCSQHALFCLLVCLHECCICSSLCPDALSILLCDNFVTVIKQSFSFISRIFPAFALLFKLVLYFFCIIILYDARLTAKLLSRWW